MARATSVAGSGHGDSERDGGARDGDTGRETRGGEKLHLKSTRLPR